MNRRLRELRKTLSLNQTEFGKRIGCTQQTICMWENKERIMRTQTAKQICREFNVNEEWFFHGKGDMFVRPKTESQGLRDFQRAFCQRVFNSLPEDVQDIVLEVVRDEYMRKDYQRMQEERLNAEEAKSADEPPTQDPGDA